MAKYSRLSHCAVGVLTLLAFALRSAQAQQRPTLGEKIEAERQFAPEVGAAVLSMYGLKDKVYILGGKETNIWVFDRQGKLLQKIIPRGVDLSDSNDLAVDANGRFIVANEGRISILDNNGALVREFGMGGIEGEKQKGATTDSRGAHRPSSLVLSVAVFQNGEILASGATGDGVATVFDSEGRKMYSIGSKLQIQGYPEKLSSLFSIGELIVDSKDNVYVIFAFVPKPTVHKYTSQGTLLAEWHPQSPVLDLIAKHERPDGYQMDEATGMVQGPILLAGGYFENRTQTLWVFTANELLVLDSEGKTTERLRPVIPGGSGLIGAPGMCLIVGDDQMLISSRFSGAYLFKP